MASCFHCNSYQIYYYNFGILESKRTFTSKFHYNTKTIYSYYKIQLSVINDNPKHFLREASKRTRKSEIDLMTLKV